jgi:hypothetical protein
MNFSDALIQLKAGEKVRNKSWATEYPGYLVKRNNKIYYHEELYTIVGDFILHSEDLLSNDWEIVDDMR